MRGLVHMAVSVLALSAWGGEEGTPAPARRRGHAAAEVGKPDHFPHRIWAACDFESQLPNYAWFGTRETANLPVYPGNVTSLKTSSVNPDAETKKYLTGNNFIAGMNPVPGPFMGKQNYTYCRYFLKGNTTARFQYFSLAKNDNNNILVTGLTEGKWSEVTLNFTRDAARNNGSPEAFSDVDRMDDLKVFVNKPKEGEYEIVLDDIIFFAEDPNIPPEKEPFPNRVLFVAGFDTGIDAKSREKYFPGEMEIVTKDKPAGTYWSCTRAVPVSGGKAKHILLKLHQPKPVGEHTKLRFRYHLTGATQIKAGVNDSTDGTRRLVELKDCKPGEWTFVYADLTKAGKRADGKDGPIAVGNKVDEIVFLAEPGNGTEVQLLIDEVTLFDAGKAGEGKPLP